MQKKQIEYYVDEKGKKPFIIWFEKLDKRSRAIVDSYEELKRTLGP